MVIENTLTYSTSQIAKITVLHPNTVRKYEEWGLMVGGVAKNSKSASVIASLLYFPMLVFSGATLPLEVMPAVVQKIVSVFPLSQGIMLMKIAFLGLPDKNVALPVIVMTSVTIICSGIAIKFFKWE